MWVLPGLLLWMAVYLACTAPAIVNPLIALLEDPYLEGPACPAGTHLVVLGGGVDSRVERADEFERMSSATLARASAAARMAIAEPGTRIIVAGGAVRKIAEATVIAAYLERMGVAAERIVQDVESMNTHENSMHVASLLEDEQVEGPVRLITSAMHMPRALNTFRKWLAYDDIEICPVSVDVQALKDVPAYAYIPQTTSISRFEIWLHEVLALLYYRLQGYL